MGPLETASMPSRIDFNSGPGYRHACEADHPDRDGEVLAHLWKLPSSFYDNHAARDLPSGVVERSNKRYRWVWLSEADRLELIDDAEYYITESYDMDQNYQGVALSLIKAVAWHRSSGWDASAPEKVIGYGSWKNYKCVDVTTDMAARKRATEKAKQDEKSNVKETKGKRLERKIAEAEKRGDDFPVFSGIMNNLLG